MKKQELIKLLQELPDNADIYTIVGDDILGDYRYSDPYLLETHGYIDEHGSINTGFSNYKKSTDKKIVIYTLK